MSEIDWRQWAKSLAHLTWWLSTFTFVLAFVSFHLPPIIDEYPDVSTNLTVTFFIVMMGAAWHAGGQINEMIPTGED